jgi:DNA primase
MEDKLIQKDLRLEQLYTLADEWFNQTLASNPDGLAYLNKRGLTLSVAKEWSIGYSTSLDSKNTLKSYANKHGFSDEELSMSELFKVGDDGLLQDAMVDRLIISHSRDRQSPFIFKGRHVALGSRDLGRWREVHLTNDKRKLRGGRYFGHTHLYGLSKTKEFIREAGSVIVSEGCLDAIRMFDNGVLNVVALSGSTLTVDYAKELKKYTNKVILCLDSDSRGISAVEAMLPNLMAANIDVYIATLPEGDDPDSFILENGVAPFKKLIRDAKEGTLKSVGRNVTENFRKRSYVSDPFKSKVFICNPERILDYLGVLDVNGDDRDYIYNLYKNNHKDLSIILKNLKG